MSLRQQAISGLAWSTSARVGQQAMQFVVSIVLARLVLPEAYGIIGMVAVFIGFAALFAEFGFGAALVQRQDLRDIHVFSVFWLNVLVGALLTGIFYAVAPLIAGFYGMPILEPVGRVLAFTFIIAAVGIVPRALLQKKMAFKSLAQIELFAAVGPGLVAIVLALRGWDVWSLVVQSLVSTTIVVALASYFCRWSPRLRFSFAAVRELFGYSAHLFGFTFINYWARHSDDLLIGKLIGSSGLGIYTRAYGLMLLPVSQVTDVVSRVMFPALSAVQQDLPRVKQIYLQATGLIAMVSFPLMMGLFVVAEPFVLTLLGRNWAAVTPVLQILCLVGLTQSLCSPTGWIYTSQGRTDWMFRWGLAGSTTLIVCIAIGASLGSVRSVAIAYLVGNLLIFYPCIHIPGKLIRMRVSEVLHEVSGILACSTLMAVLVWAIGSRLPGAWPVGVRLGLLVSAGAWTYILLILAFRPAASRPVLSALAHRLGTRPLRWADRLGLRLAEDASGKAP